MKYQSLFSVENKKNISKCHLLKCLHSIQRVEERSVCLFVFVEVLRPSQPNGVMSSVVSLPNHTFTGQA